VRGHFAGRRWEKPGDELATRGGEGPTGTFIDRSGVAPSSAPVADPLRFAPGIEAPHVLDETLRTRHQRIPRRSRDVRRRDDSKVRDQG
jgi:hypothetical protein